MHSLYTSDTVPVDMASRVHTSIHPAVPFALGKAGSCVGLLVYLEPEGAGLDVLGPALGELLRARRPGCVEAPGACSQPRGAWWDPCG